MGSRALYLYSGGKDTLFRIHGTNQPEYIGASISSGCIRMTNEDVIDLYDRVKLGTVVVVLEPKHGDSPFNSQDGAAGRRHTVRWPSNRRQRYVAVDHQERRFCRRFFVAGFFSRTVRPLPISRRPISERRLVGCIGLGCIRLRCIRIWRRPRAAALPSGRSAGNSGATCGIGSHTFHWQIR